MNKRNVSSLPKIIYVAIFLLFFILNYTDILKINIGNAAPQLFISAVVAVAFFYGEWTGLFIGMVTGALCDAFAANTVCFNMVSLMLIGLAVGLLTNRYFNQNIFSALIMSGACSFAYFFAYWLVFFVGDGVQGAWQYFICYSLPSIIYSALFILITYLPGRYLNK